MMNSDNRPILSIIVPAYNAEKTLSRCIDSLVCQDNTNLEIIISNDGSTDGTQDIIEKYAKKYSNITYIQDTNGGVSCARNRGIEIACGRWITFVDSDDYIETGIFDSIVNVLYEENPDILEYQFWVSINAESYPAQMNHLPKDILLDDKWIDEIIIPVALNIDDRKEYFIGNYTCNKVYKSEIIRAYNVLFDETRRKWEDRLFSLTFLQYAKSYYSMSQYGYYYVCGTGQSLSSKYEPDALRISVEGYCKYLEIYGAKYCFDNPYAINYFCNVLMDVAKNQFEYELDPDIMKEMFSVFVTDKTVRMLFEKCDTQDDRKKKICCAVQHGDIEEIYCALKEYAVNLKKKEKFHQRIKRIRYLLSRVKRVIVHKNDVR